MYTPIRELLQKIRERKTHMISDDSSHEDYGMSSEDDETPGGGNESEQPPVDAVQTDETKGAKETEDDKLEVSEEVSPGEEVLNKPETEGSEQSGTSAEVESLLDPLVAPIIQELMLKVKDYENEMQTRRDKIAELIKERKEKKKQANKEKILKELEQLDDKAQKEKEAFDEAREKKNQIEKVIKLTEKKDIQKKDVQKKDITVRPTKEQRKEFDKNKKEANKLIRNVVYDENGNIVSETYKNQVERNKDFMQPTHLVYSDDPYAFDYDASKTSKMLQDFIEASREHDMYGQDDELEVDIDRVREFGYGDFKYKNLIEDPQRAVGSIKVLKEVLDRYLAEKVSYIPNTPNDQVFPMNDAGSVIMYRPVANSRVHGWRYMNNEQKKQLLNAIHDFANEYNLDGLYLRIRTKHQMKDGSFQYCFYPPSAFTEKNMYESWDDFHKNMGSEEIRKRGVAVTPIDVLTDVTIIICEERERTKGKDIGNFFPYFIDDRCYELKDILKPFGIYVKDEWVASENCFYNALVEHNKYEKNRGNMHNVIPENVMESLKYRLTGKTVTKVLLDRIGKEYKIHFHVDRAKYWPQKGTYSREKKEYGWTPGKDIVSVNLGLILIGDFGHYFVNIPTIFTTNGAEHYAAYCREYTKTRPLDGSPQSRACPSRNNWIYREFQGKLIQGVWAGNDKVPRLSSADLIETWIRDTYGNHVFEPIPNAHLYKGAFSERNKKVIKNIEIAPQDFREIDWRAKKRENAVYVSDSECTTDGRHLPYAMSVCPLGEEDKIETFFGRTCVDQWMKWITEEVFNIPRSPKKDENGEIVKDIKGHTVTKAIKKVIVYFHNLSYDGRLFANQSIVSIKKNGNKIIELGILVFKEGVGSTKILLRDSLMLIPTKLAKFPSMFRTDEKEKKMFPYRFVNFDNLFSKVSFDEVVKKEEWDAEKVNKYYEVMQESFAIDKETGIISVKELVREYVESDVRILDQGLVIFRDLLKKALKVELFDYISISSLVYDYLKREAFKGEKIYEYSGELRDFIRQACSGGRCMTRNNDLYHVTDIPIADFDARSLYPSAMSVMKVPVGPPVKWEPEMPGIDENQPLSETDKRMIMEKLENGEISAFIMRIRIDKIGRLLHFPLIYIVDKNKVKQYVNAEGIEMFVDDVYLKELIKWHQIEYSVMECIYWQGGYSTKLNTVIEDLYKRRQKAQDDKNEALSTIYKLMLNSCYGKTIEKPKETVTHIVEGSVYFEHFQKYYVNIQKVEEISRFSTKKDQVEVDPDTKGIDEKGRYIFNEYIEFDEFYCPTVLGVRVLSTSKKLMNEVMVPAELHKIPIFYQDTDSMHVPAMYIDKLEEAWRKENGFPESKKLIGKELCQFHSDFPPVRGKNDTVSIESVFISKKVYCDMILPAELLTHEVTTEKEHDELLALCEPVLRMKGIPLSVLIGDDKEESVLERNKRLLGIYKGLFNGQSYEFDIAALQPRIKLCSNFEIQSLKSFKRRVNAPKGTRYILRLGAKDVEVIEEKNISFKEPN